MFTPLITLTTDFGASSPYVAVMKGVILSINPAARIIDLTHSIRPQDISHANYFLATAVPYFPPDTIHVCVVDPGVGSKRSILFAKVGQQQLLAPDNGVLTRTVRNSGETFTIRELINRQFWREQISDTFHGRDIFAPVAAHLSCGLDPAELGPVKHHWFEIPTRSAVKNGNYWTGEVQFIDDFGNVISNIPANKIFDLPKRISVGGVRSGEPHPIRWVRTYSEAAVGELVGLFSSDGYVELAVVNGNAAKLLGVKIGMPFCIEC
jgi:S-adenosylmethionine hydrolase